MARLSIFARSGNKNLSRSNKCKPARTRQYAADYEDHHRKLSMDAYYRPRLRGRIDAALWSADEMETDVMSHTSTADYQ